jgi:hypothetical protein
MKQFKGDFMKTIAKKLITVLTFTMLALGMTSCFESDAENAAEDVGESIERTADDAGDAMEDAADNAEDAMDDATN